MLLDKEMWILNDPLLLLLLLLLLFCKIWLQNVTVVCCMSPVGFFLSPATNFPIKIMQPELFKDAPEGTVPMISDVGFTNKKLLVEGEADKWMHIYPRLGIPHSDICLISRNVYLIFNL